VPTISSTSCNQAILVNEPAESVDPYDFPWLGSSTLLELRWSGRQLAKRPMRPMVVVVVDEFAEYFVEMAAPEDQHPVESFAANL
jgi:hypothetical protein